MVGGSVPSPASRARTTACARSATASLVKMFDTWLRIGLSLIDSLVAMLVFV
jgi:hypothetical protein